MQKCVLNLLPVTADGEMNSKDFRDKLKTALVPLCSREQKKGKQAEGVLAPATEKGLLELFEAPS